MNYLTSNKTKTIDGIVAIAILLTAAFAVTDAPAARADGGKAKTHAKTPADDGLVFERLSLKDKSALSKDPGGPKERIEVESTNDHIDYVTKTYVLQNANADEVWDFISNAVDKEGGHADRYAPGSNPTVHGDQVDQKFSGESLLVVTVPAWLIPYLDETIKQLDRPGFNVGAFGNASIFIHPKHRRPSEIAAHLAATTASGRQIFHADDSRNVLYLQDVPSFFALAIAAIKEFDAPPDQIDLSVKIYEIDEQNGRDVGLDWLAFKKAASGGGLDIKWSNGGSNSYSKLGLDSITGELSFNPNLATEFLNIAADHGRAKILTDTQVTLTNGVKGEVNSTTDIPYVIRGWIGGKVADQPNLDSPTATTTDASGNIVVKNFIEGVTLGITPTIGSDSVDLTVAATVSSQVGYTPDQNVPIIASSSINSELVVEPGKAALLGGLKRQRSVLERQGLPGLKDIPWVKYLFSHEVSRDRNSQIFVTLLPTKVATNSNAQPPADKALPEIPAVGANDGKKAEPTFEPKD
jgi:type II secretory pathway component GspD/PulD (secretin)